MLVSRYPLSIVTADPAQVQRRARPALSVAVAWVAMTALLPLVLESKTDAQAGAQGMVAVTQKADAMERVPKERLVAFSNVLLWPFGLTPAKAMSMDADHLRAAKRADSDAVREKVSLCQRSLRRASQQGIRSAAQQHVSIRG